MYGLHCEEKFVFERYRWFGEVMMAEFDGVADPYCSRVFADDFVASVMVQRWSDVVSVVASIIP
jgi:hypothetical protein